MSYRRLGLLGLLASALAVPGAGAVAPGQHDLLYGTEGNRLRRYDVDSLRRGPLRQDVFVERASAAEGPNGEPGNPNGRDINGMMCAFPDGSGRFVAGEDTGQPSPPAGFGLFDAAGVQVGKLTPTFNSAFPEPFGCAFAPDGTLFTTDVGASNLIDTDGQLIMWFPPFEGFPGPPGLYPDTDAVSANFCKLATDIGTATGVAIDAQGRVYVAASGRFQILRFSPPFPSGLGPGQGCEAVDAQGSPLAEFVQREVLVQASLIDPLATFTGLAMSHHGTLYAASVFTGRIGEYDLDGNLLQRVLDHPGGESLPFSFGTPQGIAVDGRGSLYYADLNLSGTLPDVGPGPDGKLWRIDFDELGAPLPPQRIRDGLAFPDGVAIFPGNLEPQWPSFAGGPERLFYNGDEAILGPHNVGDLEIKWSRRTDAVITGSPVVASVPLPGEGLVDVVYFQSWDRFVYALRVDDGSEIWRFETEEQPGASFPQTASAHYDVVDGEPRIYIGSGEIMYALDAGSGAEIWRFTVGTGCQDAGGNPPGSCSFDDERNQIESSAARAGETLVFGMDVNDRAVGKGGFLGLDIRSGALAWWFDLESGATCTPDPGDDVRSFDAYHSEVELGLPAGFFATRPGCDFPRSRNGCGNVWSSPAIDFERQAIYIASSNCDTDENPATALPPPPMPPYDEALFALDYDGVPIWRWRPREVDPDDLAFGAAPQLFEIDHLGATREVVGIGSKDGSYRVLDRDGVNAVSGVRWDDPDPSELPYWTTQVVDGGSLGGIPVTPSVDPDLRRIYFSTAPGEQPENVPPSPPQRPTVHALDMDSGAVVWQNAAEVSLDNPDFLQFDASFGPASSIPGVVFIGHILEPRLRAYRTDDDSGELLLFERLNPLLFGSAVASGAAVINGTVLVGTGIGTRTGDPDDPSELTSRLRNPLVALCVPGTPGCNLCDDGIDNDGDGLVDHAGDPGCTGPLDFSEKPDCDDRLDNDRDGAADHPADPGCRNRLPRAVESPECDDGIDNDEDGDVDTEDDECVASWDESEGSLPPPGPHCGLLGGELFLALGAGLGLRRLRRRAVARMALVVAMGLAGGDALAAPMAVDVRATLRVYAGDQLVLDTGSRTGGVFVDPVARTLRLPSGLISLASPALALPTGFLGSVTQISLSAVNASGTLSLRGANSGFCPGPLAGAGACIRGGGIGGTVPFSGQLGIPGLATSVPLAVIGAGGSTGVAAQLQGAPWTTRTAAVTTTGPTAAWFTRMGGGDLLLASPLNLVTPVHVSLPGQDARLPILLELTLALPEPGPGALFAAAGVSWAAAAWRSRRPRVRAAAACARSRSGSP